MAQSKREIQAMLSDAGTQPRHRFGQNFMIDQNLVRLVAEAGRVAGGDWVIEVGPGTGTLTEELLGRGAEVVAVEIDRDLAGLLRERWAGEGRFRLIEGDALAGKHQVNEELEQAIAAAKAAGRCPKLVANLPYNIASPLIIELMVAGVELLAFTVQKEVAERLRAQPGTEAYGVLSVMVQLMAQVEVLRTLPASAFWPAPAVESSLVRLTRADRLGGRGGALSALVHQLFSTRRKTLRKGLSMAGYDADAVLGAAGIEGGLRPEQIAPEQFIALFDAAAVRPVGGA